MLVGRGDIDERRARMVELEAQVGMPGGRGGQQWGDVMVCWTNCRSGVRPEGEGDSQISRRWTCGQPLAGRQTQLQLPQAPTPPFPNPSNTQVAEVSAQNEYQLKLRDLALGERVAEMGAAAAADAAAARAR